MAKRVTTKKIEREIEMAYYRTCGGITINMLDIPSVFAKGRLLWDEQPGDTAHLEQGLRAFVETIRS